MLCSDAFRSLPLAAHAFVRLASRLVYRRIDVNVD